MIKSVVKARTQPLPAVDQKQAVTAAETSSTDRTLLRPLTHDSVSIASDADRLGQSGCLHGDPNDGPADLVVVVGAEVFSEGKPCIKKFWLHKKRFYEISPYFRHILDTRMADPLVDMSEPIHLPNIEAITFEVVVNYINFDLLPLQNTPCGLLAHIYSAAKRFGLPELSQHCIDLLSSDRNCAVKADVDRLELGHAIRNVLRRHKKHESESNQLLRDLKDKLIHLARMPRYPGIADEELSFSPSGVKFPDVQKGEEWEHESNSDRILAEEAVRLEWEETHRKDDLPNNDGILDNEHITWEDWNTRLGNPQPCGPSHVDIPATIRKYYPNGQPPLENRKRRSEIDQSEVSIRAKRKKSSSGGSQANAELPDLDIAMVTVQAQFQEDLTMRKPPPLAFIIRPEIAVRPQQQRHIILQHPTPSSPPPPPAEPVMASQAPRQVVQGNTAVLTPSPYLPSSVAQEEVSVQSQQQLPKQSLAAKERLLCNRRQKREQQNKATRVRNQTVRTHEQKQQPTKDRYLEIQWRKREEKRRLEAEERNAQETARRLKILQQNEARDERCRKRETERTKKQTYTQSQQYHPYSRRGRENEKEVEQGEQTIRN